MRSPTASSEVIELDRVVDDLEQLVAAIDDEVAANGINDLEEDARALHKLLSAAVRRLRTSRSRAELAGPAGRAIQSVRHLAELATDDAVGRVLDIEHDGIDIVTEGSRAIVAAELRLAAPVDKSAASPVSPSYLSELRNGKKSLPSAAMADKLDRFFGTDLRSLVDGANEQIIALRRQRDGRVASSRFQPAGPGQRDIFRRQLIEEELARSAALLELVEAVLSLDRGQQQVVADIVRSLHQNTVEAGSRNRVGATPIK